MDNPYQKEVEERWGDTEAYKQSKERVSKMTKEDFERIGKEGDELMREIVRNMGKGAKSPDVQRLIDRHYNNLRHFYDPNLDMYRGLGSMYVDDKRFAAYFEKYDKNLPEFMREAMHNYCDNSGLK